MIRDWIRDTGGTIMYEEEKGLLIWVRRGFLYILEGDDITVRRAAFSHQAPLYETPAPSSFPRFLSLMEEVEEMNRSTHLPLGERIAIQVGT